MADFKESVLLPMLRLYLDSPSRSIKNVHTSFPSAYVITGPKKCVFCSDSRIINVVSYDGSIDFFLKSSGKIPNMLGHCYIYANTDILVYDILFDNRQPIFESLGYVSRHSRLKLLFSSFDQMCYTLHDNYTVRVHPCIRNKEDIGTFIRIFDYSNELVNITAIHNVYEETIPLNDCNRDYSKVFPEDIPTHMTVTKHESGVPDLYRVKDHGILHVQTLEISQKLAVLFNTSTKPDVILSCVWDSRFKKFKPYCLADV